MIYSFVIFDSKCSLKKVPCSTDSLKIINSNQVFDVLNNFNNRCIPLDEIETLYKMLSEFAHVSYEERDKHTENVKRKYH